MKLGYLLLAACLSALAAPAWADEPDNIHLPQGFHATVVADHLGVLCHLAFRDNDNLYVSTQWNNTGTSGDVIAIHLDKNHVADKTVHFGAMMGGITEYAMMPTSKFDGQRQSLRPGENRLVIQLEEGVHRLVIQKAGFQTFETDLQIRRGRTLAFNVSLVK